MTLRVLHAATHGHNIGDGALVAGMQRTLREDLRRDIEFEPLDVLDYKLEPRRVMLSRKEFRRRQRDFDLVIVGGGGMIEGAKGSFLSGINFNFDLRILLEAQVPWVFYALGVNQFPGTYFFHRRQLRGLMSLCSDRGFPFSLRNDDSAQRLDALLPGAVNEYGVTTIPDPGFWVPEGRRDQNLSDGSEPRIVVQLAGDRRRQRRVSKNALKGLASCLVRLVCQFEARILLAPHLLADLAPLADLVHQMPSRVVRRACRMLPVYAGSRSAPDFFQAYRDADVVLGMRGHSMICAIGVGVPVVGLGTHPKVGGLLRELNLENWYVNLSDQGVGERLERVTTGILAERSVARARVSQLLPTMRERSRRFHREIEGLL